MFVDLFVCTLIAFFLLYRPKKVFTGKKLRIFRAFVIIPVAWSVVGYIFLALNDGGAVIPGYIFPLIPLKPPMFLLVFLALVTYLKIQEWHYTECGMTEEEFNKHFFSAKSVNDFSTFVSVALAIASLIDIFVIIFANNEMLERIGFGQSAEMFVAIPIIMFYDFSKNIKNPIVGILIPVIGVVLIVIIYIETGFWIVGFGIEHYLKPFLDGIFGDDSA